MSLSTIINNKSWPLCPHPTTKITILLYYITVYFMDMDYPFTFYS